MGGWQKSIICFCQWGWGVEPKLALSRPSLSAGGKERNGLVNSSLRVMNPTVTCGRLSCPPLRPCLSSAGPLNPAETDRSLQKIPRSESPLSPSRKGSKQQSFAPPLDSLYLFGILVTSNWSCVHARRTVFCVRRSLSRDKCADSSTVRQGITVQTAQPLGSYFIGQGPGPKPS